MGDKTKRLYQEFRKFAIHLFMTKITAVTGMSNTFALEKLLKMILIVV